MKRLVAAAGVLLIASAVRLVLAAPPEHPDTAKFEPLLNFLVDFAEQQVKKQGAFLPFAGAQDRAGGMVPMMALDTDHPEAQAAIGMHWKLFEGTARKEGHQAVGVCFDVRVMTVKGKKDAICVEMETSDGKAMRFTEPYAKAPSGQWTFDHLSASPLEARVFRSNGI